MIKDKQDKFINKDRIDTFIRYIENINKQYYLYTLDLEQIIKSYTIKFVKNKNKEDINLRLRKQIFNILSNKRSVKRLPNINIAKNTFVLIIDASIVATPSKKMSIKESPKVMLEEQENKTNN